jgi:hypothetical protein
MQCENPTDCPAKKNPKKPCWEIASELDDYRKAFNICRDCVVHLLKLDNSLSNQEINEIMRTKTNCALAHERSRHPSQTLNVITPPPPIR